ncbi:hypothetical protein PFISCL1PPCAC_16490, partial [Pristionchus fissidentatus]
GLLSLLSPPPSVPSGMRISLLVLLLPTVIHSQESAEKLGADCGSLETTLPKAYCHVDPDCLYGPKKKPRRSPIFLSRYYKLLHPNATLSNCRTFLKYNLSLGGMEGSGWIDPDHFAGGIQFYAGRSAPKIIKIDPSGMTDKDEAVYYMGKNFKVFNGTFNTTQVDGKLRIQFEATKINGHSPSLPVFPVGRAPKAEKLVAAAPAATNESATAAAEQPVAAVAAVA